jgi:shikimate dehydrogenase
MAKSRPEFGHWRYFKFDIAPAELAAALTEFHAQGFLGLNLTVPHKSLALDCLTHADDVVRRAGAANTLKRFPDGWHGYNTDGLGLSAALQEKFGVKLAGAQVILLGAGGAARGVAVECLSARCASLSIGNRTAAHRETLRGDLQPFAGETDLRTFDLAEPGNLHLPAGAIVLNATSLGLNESDPAPIDLGKSSAPIAVYDMIYRPPQTALLRQAAALGIPCANGLSMLIHQGARSLELWTGAMVPVDVMQRAIRAALNPA